MVRYFIIIREVEAVEPPCLPREIVLRLEFYITIEIVVAAIREQLEFIISR